MTVAAAGAGGAAPLRRVGRDEEMTGEGLRSVNGRINSSTSLWLAAALVLLAVLVPGRAAAGTTGKLAGRVLDARKQPVEAATVRIAGTKLGAYTQADGSYSILNIPSGTYEVSFSRMGFGPQRVQGVIVSSDQTTKLDAALGEATVTAAEVIVTAERPPVDISVTSTSTTLTTEEIQQLPVQNLEDVVNLQAGVVKGHFRGGREGEVQYQVDGVSMNNSYSNKPMLNLDRSLLQEVQIISGTFDAEYGQAMSGVVNAVLKQGTETFEWSGEVFSGGSLFPGGQDRRLTDDTFRPAATQNYQLSVGGPTPLPDTVFLLSGRRFVSDDYIRVDRLFLPTDSSDFGTNELHPTGDGASVPLGFSRLWSGVAKVTNSHFANLKLNYQAVFENNEGRRGNFAFRFVPDGMTQQKTFTISHGLDLTRTLDKDTFFNFNARQNYLRYTDYAYEDVFDPRYDAAGPPQGSPNYERGAFIEGVDTGRFRQITNALLFKTSLTSQVTPVHLVKVGGELELPRVEFGSPGYLGFRTVAGVDSLLRFIDSPPDFPSPRTYRPRSAALFAQDQMEWSDLTVRAGLRFDYMDARATVPSDLANPANAIAGQPLSVPVPTTVKTAISPRLGIAYPIEDKAAVHFAYGHFRQFPSINDMFSNADYNVLYNLQAGVLPATLGNPDVKPEQTIQYEIGYKHALTPDLGADLTVFYKDIRDLLGVEFIDTYNDAQYPRLTNVDFGNVFGITLSLDHRRLGPASIAFDYTWQQATGNSSDPRETAVRASAGEDPRPRLLPFSWDQRHTVNMTVALSRPQDYTASAVLRVASGQPYTPALDAGFGQGLEANSGRKPAGVLLDLRLEKALPRVTNNLLAFVRMFNVFDTRYFNGTVFSSTGSPYYSRFPTTDWTSLQDPGRFNPPRRIEIGFRLGSGGL
jgi:outer membrane receptor protein involved in Fe transport